MTEVDRSERVRGKELLYSDFENDYHQHEEVKGNHDNCGTLSGHQVTSVPFGFQNKGSYLHASKNCDIQCVTYNSKTNQYIIVDSRGITSWTRSYLVNSVSRLMDFPSYHFNVIMILLYVRKFNIYFALSKEYQLKIYNLNFHETFSIESETNTVLHVVFNSVTDELITAGRGSLQFWTFGHLNPKDLVKSSYGLVLNNEWKVADGMHVNKVELDKILQRIYCLADKDVWCYNMDGRLLFHLRNVSSSLVSACVFSVGANMLCVGSIDGQINVWTTTGGKVSGFSSHTRIVTSMLVHPSDGCLIITSSMDGTIRIYSLDTFEEMYCLPVFHEGIFWMELRSKNILHCASSRGITLLDLNYSYTFWGHLRYPARAIKKIYSSEKSTRIMATGEDNSVRLFSQSTGKKLCTVLPPPTVTSLDHVISVSYDRKSNLVYMLVSHIEIWVYTTKTDPACRLAVLNLDQPERLIKSSNLSRSGSQTSRSRSSNFDNLSSSVPAVKSKEDKVQCNCLTMLCNKFIEGIPIDSADSVDSFNLLACGMQSGKLVMYNPQKGRIKQGEIDIHKNPITNVNYLEEMNCLLLVLQDKDGLSMQLLKAVTFECVFDMLNNAHITDFSLKETHLAIGYSSGQIRMCSISTKLSSKDKLLLSAKHEKPATDHNGKVLSVDFHPTLDILCSSGTDGLVKIWDKHKVLLCDIQLDNTLRTACFLNSAGDILVGFRSQIFVVSHNIIDPMLKWIYDEDNVNDQNNEKESAVYESPHIKYETKRPLSPQVTNIENYLVPYQNLNFSNSWLVKDYSKESANSESSFSLTNRTFSDDDISLAPTEVYASTHHSRSRTSSMTSHTFDHWELPECGFSPTPESVPEILASISTEVSDKWETPKHPKAEQSHFYLAHIQQKTQPHDIKQDYSKRTIRFNHDVSDKLKNMKIGGPVLNKVKHKGIKNKKLKPNPNRQEESKASDISQTPPSIKSYNKRQIIKKTKNRSVLTSHKDQNSRINKDVDTVLNSNMAGEERVNDNVTEKHNDMSEVTNQKALIDQHTMSVHESGNLLVQSPLQLKKVQNAPLTNIKGETPKQHNIVETDIDKEEDLMLHQTNSADQFLNKKQHSQSPDSPIMENLSITDELSSQHVQSALSVNLSTIFTKSDDEINSEIAFDESGLSDISTLKTLTPATDSSQQENLLESPFMNEQRNITAVSDWLDKSSMDQMETGHRDRSVTHSYIPQKLTKSVHFNLSRSVKAREGVKNYKVVAANNLKNFNGTFAKASESNRPASRSSSHTDTPLSIISLARHRRESKLKTEHKSDVMSKKQVESVSVKESSTEDSKGRTLIAQSGRNMLSSVGRSNLLTELSAVKIPHGEASFNMNTQTFEKQQKHGRINIGQKTKSQTEIDARNKDLMNHCLGAFQKRRLGSSQPSSRVASSMEYETKLLEEHLPTSLVEIESLDHSSSFYQQEEYLKDKDISNTDLQLQEQGQESSAPQIRIEMKQLPYLEGKQKICSDIAQETQGIPVSFQAKEIIKGNRRKSSQCLDVFNDVRLNLVADQSSTHTEGGSEEFKGTNESHMDGRESFQTEKPSVYLTPQAIFDKSPHQQEYHTNVSTLQTPEASKGPHAAFYEHKYQEQHHANASPFQILDIHGSLSSAERKPPSLSSYLLDDNNKDEDQTFADYDDYLFNNEISVQISPSPKHLEEKPFSIPQEESPVRHVPMNKYLREKLLHRKSLQRRNKERQNSAKLKREKIGEDRLDRGHLFSRKIPTTISKYEQDTQQTNDQPLDLKGVVYEYFKPEPLLRMPAEEDKRHIDVKRKKFEARLSGQPYRHGVRYMQDDNEVALVSFLRLSLMKSKAPNLLHRPKSSSSIPAKCRQFLLVRTEMKERKEEVPSRTETRLITERFPKTSFSTHSNALGVS